jgi:radical SAM protein with 4Fe4S-binding SPASM domain
MFDIDFYMKIGEFKKSLPGGGFARYYVLGKLEECRNREPFVFNLETTNDCNMKCRMCPRTTKMTRPIETMEMDLFSRITDQISPFSEKKWSQWENFVESYYGIPHDDMSENHFFLYVIPRVLVLYGYGDPLLDEFMVKRLKLLSSRGIPSYFSCNPMNMDTERVVEMFGSGLDYIKFSIESVHDSRQIWIRGAGKDFEKSHKKIVKLLGLKKKYGYRTTVVVTMLNFNDDGQEKEFSDLKKAFRGLDVYLYEKSLDQKWLHGVKYSTRSIHWNEFCQFPWSSMTIKSNGEVVMCVTDYNNEIVLGDVNCQRLYEIWNGEKYGKFRQDHFIRREGAKCTSRCDMKLVGDLF